MLKSRNTHILPHPAEHAGNAIDSVLRAPWPFPASVPVKEIQWPDGGTTHLQTQVQQLRNFTKPQTTPIGTTLPIQSRVQPRTTPQNVKRIRIIRRSATDTHEVRVQFFPTPGDPYFQKTNVYLRQGSTGNPVLVASGSTSPLKFTTPKTSLPSTVVVTAVGPAGETDLASAPSANVDLT